MEINQLSQRMQRLMELEGFHSLTPIQQEVIPVALQGKDIIGISNTGRMPSCCRSWNRSMYPGRWCRR